MNDADRQYLAAATARIDRLLHARGVDPISPSGLSAELQGFAEAFDRLLEQLAVFRQFAVTLAHGDLSYEAPARQHLLDPLKHLQASLRHLTWQTQQVAAGDLDQCVDFLGEFSIAFNQMIQGLRDKRAADDQIRHLSLHDALTGLYNRLFFNQEMERLATSDEFPITILVTDLDDLKRVNDTRGHQTGDLLIQRAARLIEHGVRTEDAVVRLGGDEFAVLLYGIGQSEAETIVQRLRATLVAHNRRNPMLAVSLSIGAATAEGPASLEAALRQADQAMYQDKCNRKGRDRPSHTEPRPSAGTPGQPTEGRH
ncbi:GGDEF domain-containing protein [Thioalkalicoccus limnaeus]|uniref:diguanylate cyclase n=1 Tax=Thioalkalicoccus limnaeus TaxID=120681 RepID=A0ABV4BCL8_9GAMM